MKDKNHKFLSILLRYFILLLIALPNFWILYFVFTPLTVFSVGFILNLFFDTIRFGEVIIIDNVFPIEIVSACVAGSAYYLLLILNLSIANIKTSERMKMISISFAAFFTINVVRIVILSFIFLSNFTIFVIAHKIFWYFMSTIFVVAIWFFEVKFFKIKELPFYSDLRFLYNNSTLKK